MNEAQKTAWPSFRREEHDYRQHRQADGFGGGGPDGAGNGRISVLEAMRRHWHIALATTAILVVAGVGLGLVRTPVYTAEGRLAVQVAAPYPTAVPGSITASSSLASIYSRAIYAPSLIDHVAQQTELSPSQVADRISATQVPDTGVIRVSATGPSETSAVSLANQTTPELQRYVGNNLQGSSPQSQFVLRKYKKAAQRAQVLFHHLQVLESQFGSSLSTANKELRRARIQTQAAAVERDGLARAYQNGQQLYTAPLEVIGRATNASSDRLSRLELFALLGLVAGLGVGAVLATVQANSGTTRRA